eukprot:1110218-Amorphochlora_amoeboformis.AAC.1
MFSIQIARRNGYGKIAVIAGIGTRRYYQKLGYRLEGTYMVKHMDPWRKVVFIDHIYPKTATYI